MLCYRLVALRWSICQLTGIARVLRERRDEGGALELEGVEVRIQVGEEKAVEDLIPKQVKKMVQFSTCVLFFFHFSVTASLFLCNILSVVVAVALLAIGSS